MKASFIADKSSKMLYKLLVLLGFLFQQINAIEEDKKLLSCQLLQKKQIMLLKYIFTVVSQRNNEYKVKAQYTRGVSFGMSICFI